MMSKIMGGRRLPVAAGNESEAQVESVISETTWSRLRMSVIVRLITAAFLILSVSFFATNSTTIPLDDTNTVTARFNDIYAYRYAVSTAALGLAYTSVRQLSSIHHLRSGKPPLNPKTPLYHFIGDKVVLAMLATGVGAAFGATVDLKAKMDDVLGFLVYEPVVSDIDHFFKRAYLPSIFLLISFLASGVSSFLSSFALINNNNI